MDGQVVIGASLNVAKPVRTSDHLLVTYDCSLRSPGCLTGNSCRRRLFSTPSLNSKLRRRENWLVGGLRWEAIDCAVSEVQG